MMTEFPVLTELDTPTSFCTEALRNFSLMLEGMDFVQELATLGIGKFHFRRRERALRELRAMSIGLWRLALQRSFPADGETIFERFMLGLYERARSPRERERANAFDLLVRSYVERLNERGDGDFTAVSGHIVDLFQERAPDVVARRLKLALLMRNAYLNIFRHLI